MRIDPSPMPKRPLKLNASSTSHQRKMRSAVAKMRAYRCRFWMRNGKRVSPAYPVRASGTAHAGGGQKNAREYERREGEEGTPEGRGEGAAEEGGGRIPERTKRGGGWVAQVPAG